MSYKVLIALTIVELVQQVNEAINEGWWPQGGIAVRQMPQKLGAMYYQAMMQQSPSFASLKQAAEELAALRGASVREHRESIENRSHDGFGQ